MTAKIAIERIKKAYDKRQENLNTKLYTDFDKMLFFQGLIDGFETTAKIDANEILNYINQLENLRDSLK